MVGAWMPAQPQYDTTHFTWAEAKEMHERGHEMSNHTWSHPDMTTLTPEQLEQEIRKNGHLFQKMIVILFFSYM